MLTLTGLCSSVCPVTPFKFTLLTVSRVATMNVKRLFSGFITAAIASTAVMAPFSDANAGPAESRFSCLSRNGTPATVALTKRGPVPVINWTSTLGDGVYTPQVRCDIVSKKFQQFYEDGTLNFLTTGRKNGYPVVCVALYKGGACTNDLFTLKPGSNPGRTLRQLMAVRTGSTGPLNESAAREYIDVKDLLETGAVDNSIAVPGNAAVETPEPAETTVVVSPVEIAPQVTPTPTPSVTPFVATPEVEPTSETPINPGLW